MSSSEFVLYLSSSLKASWLYECGNVCTFSLLSSCSYNVLFSERSQEGFARHSGEFLLKTFSYLFDQMPVQQVLLVLAEFGEQLVDREELDLAH